MVSACDGSLQGSVKSHPDAGPPTFISVSADAKLLSKSSKFIVCVQVSMDFLSSHSTFFILLSKCIREYLTFPSRLRIKVKFIRNIFVSEIEIKNKT